MARLFTPRRLLETGILAGGATLALLGALSGSAAPVAVGDARSEGYRDFVRQCHDKAIEVLTITHEVDPAWQLIRSRWQRSPFPLIGLTRPSAFVLFSELCRTEGPRIESKTGTSEWVSWTLVPVRGRL